MQAARASLPFFVLGLRGKESFPAECYVSGGGRVLCGLDHVEVCSLYTHLVQSFFNYQYVLNFNKYLC